MMAKNRTRYDVRNPEILQSIVNQGGRGLTQVTDDAENISLGSDLTDISDMRPIGRGTSSTTDSFTFTDEDDEHENQRGLGFSLSRNRPVQMNRQRSKSTTLSDMRSRNSVMSVAKTPYSKSRKSISNAPRPGTGDTQFEHLVSMLSSLQDDVRASNKNQDEFQRDMGQFKTSIEERLKRLEDLEADKAKQPDPSGLGLGLGHGEQKQGNRVPADISRYIGHVYGTSPGLTYNPADPFRSRSNQEVKMRLMDELKAKFAESSYDKEFHNAAYNRYKNSRQKHIMEEAGKTEQLLNKRKCNVIKHRKLNSRRKACENDEEREYWDGVGVDLMSDEENGGEELSM